MKTPWIKSTHNLTKWQNAMSVIGLLGKIAYQNIQKFALKIKKKKRKENEWEKERRNINEKLLKFLTE